MENHHHSHFHQHQHQYQYQQQQSHSIHASPVMARQTRGDILKPSPKARKLNLTQAAPSSAEWSTGSSSDDDGHDEDDDDPSFNPPPHALSPLRNSSNLRRPTTRRYMNSRKARLRANGSASTATRPQQQHPQQPKQLLQSSPQKRKRNSSYFSDTEMDSADSSSGSEETVEAAEDEATLKVTREGKEAVEGEEDEEADPKDSGPTDGFLLREASDKQLHRLLKADLIRVHLMTGIWDDETTIDPDMYTKDDLVGGIMHWRNHIAPEDADEPSSNDNEAEDEEAQEPDSATGTHDGAETPRVSSGSRSRTTRQQRKHRKQASSSCDDGDADADEDGDGDTTLLSRRNSSLVHSYKPPTPQLAKNDAEAKPAESFDELNGLDLEGLNLVDKEIHPSKLEKLEKIGSGGFKDVYVGKYHISKTRINKVAIADIRDQLTEMDIKELSLLRDLKHENIVRFIGVSIPEEPNGVPVMIVSELCSNGDLFDYIRNTAPPADDEIFRILLETARGLAYLHTRKPAIIHRDCKSTNVLITRNRTAKINDFGLARVKNSTRTVVRSIVGTVNWQAAELWVPKPQYNEKVDVWSAAMTFWEALQWHLPEKKYPFQGMNQHQIYLDVGQKRQRPYTGSIRRQYGDEIVELLDRMWHHSPRERPTMTAVCEELEVLIAQKRSVSAPTKRTR